MPRLTFPADPRGLKVDVVVGLGGAATTLLVNQGQPIPAPVRAQGLIDTGSTVTGVARAIVQRLALPRYVRTNTQTASGSALVGLYVVSLGIQDFALPAGPKLVEPTLVVMELPSAISGVDVLVGLDVLMKCQMILNGPAQQLILDF
jgi:hypothetical protein